MLDPLWHFLSKLDFVGLLLFYFQFSSFFCSLIVVFPNLASLSFFIMPRVSSTFLFPSINLCVSRNVKKLNKQEVKGLEFHIKERSMTYQTECFWHFTKLWGLELLAHFMVTFLHFIVKWKAHVCLLQSSLALKMKRFTVPQITFIQSIICVYLYL